MTANNPPIEHPKRPQAPPLSLWLHWDEYGDESIADSTSWSFRQVLEEDEEYVHAGEVRRALMGHRCSELWGDAGLIAATMRCVRTLGRIEELVTTDHESREAFIQRVRTALGHPADGI